MRVNADLLLHGYQVSLSGRIDLVAPRANPPQLAEIKTCLAPAAALPRATRDAHWAQLKIYGFCYAAADADAQRFELQLIWYNLNDRQQTVDSAYFTPRRAAYIYRASTRALPALAALDRRSNAAPPPSALARWRSRIQRSDPASGVWPHRSTAPRATAV